MGVCHGVRVRQGVGVVGAGTRRTGVVRRWRRLRGGEPVVQRRGTRRGSMDGMRMEMEMKMRTRMRMKKRMKVTMMGMEMRMRLLRMRSGECL